MSASMIATKTVQLFKDRGWTWGKVEQRIPIGGGGGKVSRDLWGVGDYVSAILPQMRHILVQAGAYSRISHKIKGMKYLLDWEWAILNDRYAHPNDPLSSAWIMEAAMDGEGWRIPLLIWLASGGELVIWGWRKVNKKRGGKQKIWVMREVWVDWFGETTEGEGYDPR